MGGWPTDAETDWWTAQNGELFATISGQLPGSIDVQFPMDDFKHRVLDQAKNPVYVDRRVI